MAFFFATTNSDALASPNDCSMHFFFFFLKPKKKKKWRPIYHEKEKLY